jgi:hypothetical protein
MSQTLESTVEELKAQNAVMLSNPQRELVGITRLEGARNTHLMPILHTYAFTFAQHEFFYHLKDLALKEKLPLDSLKVVAKALLEFEAGRSKGFFAITEFPNLMLKVRSALDLVKTYGEYVKLIEQFQQYVSLWCYWADIHIPFDRLTDAYERFTKSRSRKRS